LLIQTRILIPCCPLLGRCHRGVLLVKVTQEHQHLIQVTEVQAVNLTIPRAQVMEVVLQVATQDPSIPAQGGLQEVLHLAQAMQVAVVLVILLVVQDIHQDHPVIQDLDILLAEQVHLQDQEDILLVVLEHLQAQEATLQVELEHLQAQEDHLDLDILLEVALQDQLDLQSRLQILIQEVLDHRSDFPPHHLAHPHLYLAHFLQYHQEVLQEEVVHTALLEVIQVHIQEDILVHLHQVVLHQQVSLLLL